MNKLETLHSATDVVLNRSVSFATKLHYKVHNVVTDTTGIKSTASFTLQIYIYIQGLVKKYPHWCLNVLWVGGTAFCTRMLADSTFVSARGKFQHHHTV